VDKSERTLNQNAANGRKEPKVWNAAQSLNVNFVGQADVC